MNVISKGCTDVRTFSTLRQIREINKSVLIYDTDFVSVRKIDFKRRKMPLTITYNSIESIRTTELFLFDIEQILHPHYTTDKWHYTDSSLMTHLRLSVSFTLVYVYSIWKSHFSVEHFEIPANFVSGMIFFIHVYLKRWGWFMRICQILLLLLFQRLKKKISSFLNVKILHSVQLELHKMHYDISNNQIPHVPQLELNLPQGVWISIGISREY